MALPTLLGWSAARTRFTLAVRQWFATPFTVVAAKGPEQAEVSAPLDKVPPRSTVVIAVLTSSFGVAFARGLADPSRGFSRERAFLFDVFGRWAEQTDNR
jgi:hypothetical protein